MASFLSAAVIVAIGFIIKAEIRTARYRLQLENSYSRNFDDFSAALNNIATTLNKARFVTTAEHMGNMASQLLTEAEISKAALSQLPAGEELTMLNRFLSQVGNYAAAVSKTIASEGAVSKSDSENIEILSNTARKIATLVGDAHISYNNSDYWAKELDQKIEASVDSGSLNASLGQLEEELADFPTLVYDGPYSDHILEKEPAMLQNAHSVTQNEAHEIAVKYAERKQGDLKFDGEIEGGIPSYRFVGEGLTVGVSKTGGYTVYMRKESVVEESLLSFEQAVEKARRYLERIGHTSFIETYYNTTEGVCVVNFAYLDGETICYTDLVKVGVAMDDGEIVLYEASGYISNHRDRAFETPVYTPEQAEEKLSSDLVLNSTAMALIPTFGTEEVRCYEFACTSSDGQDVLVYINATTLKEEDILILLKSDGGTLVK